MIVKKRENNNYYINFYAKIKTVKNTIERAMFTKNDFN